MNNQTVTQKGQPTLDMRRKVLIQDYLDNPSQFRETISPFRIFDIRHESRDHLTQTMKDHTPKMTKATIKNLHGETPDDLR